MKIFKVGCIFYCTWELPTALSTIGGYFFNSIQVCCLFCVWMKLPVLSTGDFSQAFQCFALQFPKIHAKNCSSVYSTTLASRFQLKCNSSLVWLVWYCQLASLDAPQTCSGHLQPATQHFTIQPWKSSTKRNYDTLGRFGGFFSALFFLSKFSVSKWWRHVLINLLCMGTMGA